MNRTEKWLVIVLPPLVCAAVAVGLGLDANWDLRNYHYYNAYAFLTGRLTVDIAPGQRQTFQNPLPDLPFFRLAQSWPPLWLGAALGAVHGWNLTFLWLIFHETTQWSRPRHRWAIGVLMSWVALRAPGFQSELGNTMNDNLLSLFVLCGLWLLLAAARDAAAPRWGRVALAGGVMGAGLGLKPTILPYIVASGTALPWLWTTWPARWRALGAYALAGLAGTVVTAGWWSWQLWTAFGNPTFPYLNQIFRSPFVAPWSFADTRFLPRLAWEYFAWPILFTVEPLRVSEQPFRDIRFPILYVLAVIAVAHALLRWRRGKPTPEPICRAFPVRFLAVFAGVAFVLWMLLFSIYRYLIALELLAPLLGLVALDRTFRRRQAKLEAGVLLVLAVVTASRPLDWGRARWDGRHIEVRNVATLGLTDRSVVMLLGTSPLSYVIPSFPPAVRFVRPEGNLSLRPGDRLYGQIASTITDADRIFLVYRDGDGAVNLPVTLAQWGLNSARPACAPLDTNIPDKLVVCGLNPASP